jgi:hypothetical protein
LSRQQHHCQQGLMGLTKMNIIRGTFLCMGVGTLKPFFLMALKRGGIKFIDSKPPDFFFLAASMNKIIIKLVN